MTPAAQRLLALGAVALMTLATAQAADAQRSAPMRPGAALALPSPAFPVTKISGVDYVNVSDVARRLGLTGAWSTPLRKFTLTGRSDKVEFTAGDRETLVNGLRVFLGDPTVMRRGVLYVSRIDVERCLTPLLRPDLAGPLPLPVKVIALDPGHGGTDPGKENARLGLKEKELTLDVALLAKPMLEAHGYLVVLTRTGDGTFSADKKVDLPMRAKVANDAAADLYVSIHFNSLDPNTKVTGTEIYTFPAATQHASDWWSALKKVDLDLEPMDEPVNRYDAWSAVLAQSLHRSLMGSLKTVDRGTKTMHLGVLRSLTCPGVLVEAGFLSNDDEAGRIATPAYRRQIAAAIVAGIEAYAATLDSLRPKPAPAAADPISK